MMGYRNTVSCRSLFKRLGILPLTSQYILSLMLFVVKNKHFLVLFQYVIYHAIFVPICDLPLATLHTASEVTPATP